MSVCGDMADVGSSEETLRTVLFPFIQFANGLKYELTLAAPELHDFNRRDAVM